MKLIEIDILEQDLGKRLDKVLKQQKNQGEQKPNDSHIQ